MAAYDPRLAALQKAVEAKTKSVSADEPGGPPALPEPLICPGCGTRRAQRAVRSETESGEPGPILRSYASCDNDACDRSEVETVHIN